MAHKKHRCALCKAPVAEEYFCHGCQEYVCDACEANPVNPPLGRHKLADHTKEDE